MQPSLDQNQPVPPIILVQTWCQLLRCEEPEPAKHARKILLNAFGDMQTVVEFVKENNM